MYRFTVSSIPPEADAPLGIWAMLKLFPVYIIQSSTISLASEYGQSASLYTFIYLGNSPPTETLLHASKENLRVGGLLPEATTQQKGLMPKEYIDLTLKNEVWYEVSFTGSIIFNLIHPFSPCSVMISMFSSWSQSVKGSKVLISKGIDNLDIYLRIPNDNNIKKIYIKGGNSGNGSIISIKPIAADVTYLQTSDDVESIAFTRPT